MFNCSYTLGNIYRGQAAASSKRRRTKFGNTVWNVYRREAAASIKGIVINYGEPVGQAGLKPGCYTHKKHCPDTGDTCRECEPIDFIFFYKQTLNFPMLVIPKLPGTDQQRRRRCCIFRTPSTTSKSEGAGDNCYFNAVGKLSINSGNGWSPPSTETAITCPVFTDRSHSFIAAAPGDTLVRGVLWLDNSGKRTVSPTLQLLRSPS